MLNIKQYEKLSCRCLVIGDIMLDSYIHGIVARVSPEAPVPVVNVEKYSHSLGGAANVAAGISSLGGNVKLIGIIGVDLNGDIVRKMLRDKSIVFEGIQSQSCLTSIKTRLIGNGHQIARYDNENAEGLLADDEAFLATQCICSIANSDIVVISDYNKGVCTPYICKTVIEAAKKLRIPVIIDPKQHDWTRYKGAYLIAPNFKEFSSAATYSCEHADSIPDVSKRLLQKYDIENILVTRSHDGMTLVNNSEISDFQTKAKEVYDVSGAGDTVIATLSTFLAAGAQLKEAVIIANSAAGIAVGKFGTYAVTFKDLERNQKVYDGNIYEYVDECKTQGKKIVFTNGCFDIIHIGHVSLLKQAKQFGDVLIVGVNSDSSVKRIKGSERPINNEMDRAAILAAFEVVDAVVIFDEDTPLELIKRISPDVLVKGGDYTTESVVGADIVIPNGGQVELIKLVASKSTTGIVRSIRETSQ